MNSQDTITLLAAGDVCVNRADPDSIFALITPVIASADLTFCQLETTYSHRGAPAHNVTAALRADPRNAPSIQKAGFQIVSFAGNHCKDWGHDAFFDTIENIENTGAIVVGVGRNIEAARQPKIVERKGKKIAFLAYCSILPDRYWADSRRPGCAPLRARTFYEQVEPSQPGNRARVFSVAYPEDKAALVEDIRRAKTLADTVLVSIHWGIHFKEAEIAAYQKEFAYAAIDAGADAILGHHAHILKAIEIYKGKPIIYSLANFAFDLPHPDDVLNSDWWREFMTTNPSWFNDPEYRNYPFPRDSRMSMLVRLEISGRDTQGVSFLPLYINSDGQPRVLSSQDSEFEQVIQYMRKITENQKIKTTYTVRGNEVVVS